MEIKNCEAIQLILAQEAKLLGWDDFVYTFTLSKDWVEPDAQFVREVSSPAVGRFLEKYKALGIKYTPMRLASVQSDLPQLIDLQNCKRISSDHKLARLTSESGWKFSLTWPVYGYGGARGFLVLFSSHNDVASSKINETISHLCPFVMKFNAWARALLENPVEIKKLSPRETECMLLAAEGKTSKEIALILSIAKCTVDFHIQNGKLKLGSSSRTQAVSLMRREIS